MHLRKKMYKRRIKQWGLDKKNKEKEMRAVVRKKTQLADGWKLVKFRIRGQSVDYNDVIRYWDRKGMRIEDVIAQRDGSKTPDTVDCFFSLPYPSTTLEPMTNPERVLINIRDYFRASFENGTWLATDPHMNCETTKDRGDAFDHLYTLRERSRAACTFFDDNRFQEGGEALISATSVIKEIIMAEHPLTLTCVCLAVAYLLHNRRYEVAMAILRQLSALAEILLGERHPLCRISRELASTRPSQLDDMISRCIESTGDHFEDNVGTMNWSTLVCRFKMIDEVDIEHDMSHKSLLLQDLLDRCQSALGYLDRRTSKIRLYLAAYKSMDVEIVGALKLDWDMGACVQHRKISPDTVSLHAEGFSLLANSQYALGETYSAEEYLRKAINLRVSEWGPHDYQVRHWNTLLEEWYVRRGQLRLSSSGAANIDWKITEPV